MKKTTLNLYEQRLPPDNINNLWLDKDENTGEIKAIHRYNKSKGEWEPYLVSVDYLKDEDSDLEGYTKLFDLIFDDNRVLIESDPTLTFFTVYGLGLHPRISGYGNITAVDISTGATKTIHNISYKIDFADGEGEPEGSEYWIGNINGSQWSIYVKEIEA